jgi:hypothetical protein
MAHYSVEDIEILRQKSGISYEEAVNLLEYHNGSLARSLVDLEKNGRLHETRGTAYGTAYGKRAPRFMNRMYRTRVRFFKSDATIVNISLLFFLFALLVAPWLVVMGAIAALLLGYRIMVERNSAAFRGDSLENMVKNAGQNVRNTVTSIARDISAATAQNQAHQEETAQEQPAAPSAETRSENPASGTTPVSVQFSEDGSVRTSETRDGFHEAEIE